MTYQGKYEHTHTPRPRCYERRHRERCRRGINYCHDHKHNSEMRGLTTRSEAAHVSYKDKLVIVIPTYMDRIIWSDITDNMLIRLMILLQPVVENRKLFRREVKRMLKEQQYLEEIIEEKQIKYEEHSRVQIMLSESSIALDMQLVIHEHANYMQQLNKDIEELKLNLKSIRSETVTKIKKYMNEIDEIVKLERGVIQNYMIVYKEVVQIWIERTKKEIVQYKQRVTELFAIDRVNMEDVEGAKIMLQRIIECLSTYMNVKAIHDPNRLIERYSFLTYEHVMYQLKIIKATQIERLEEIKERMPKSYETYD